MVRESSRWSKRPAKTTGNKKAKTRTPEGRQNGDNLRRYIAKQEAHHRKHSFVDEFKELLGKAGIEYEEKCLL